MEFQTFLDIFVSIIYIALSLKTGLMHGSRVFKPLAEVVNILQIRLIFTPCFFNLFLVNIDFDELNQRIQQTYHFFKTH